MKPFAALDSLRISRPAAGRLIPATAWGLAVLVAGWVAADLFWRFNTPPTPALPPPQTAEPRQAAEAIASRHLMGLVQAPGAAASAGGQISVLAVVTGTDAHPGWAVLSVDGGPQQGVVEGQEIRPGLQLTRVLADGIELPGGQRVGLSRNAAPGILEHNNPASDGALAVAPDGNINMPATNAAIAAPPTQAGGFVGGLNQLQNANHTHGQLAPGQMYGGDSTAPNTSAPGAPISSGTPVTAPSNQ